jgi:two-component system response regulator FlrC
LDDQPALPAVVVSGYATGTVSEGLKTSFPTPVAIMPKPVRIEDVMAVLKRMLPPEPAGA